MPRCFPCLAILLALWAPALGVRAQTEPEGETPGPDLEEPDPTRLDVERLPPEAIRVTRDLYARGFFLESSVGARGFVQGIGRVVAPGFHFDVGVGYELTRWFAVRLAFDASLHQTTAPTPPAQSVVQLIGVIAEARFAANVSPRIQLFLGGEFGTVWVLGDVLRTYGYQDISTTGLTYGGRGGIDYHFRDRHHSMGLAGGARYYPSLASPYDQGAIGWQGDAYFRYVFGR